MILRTIRHIKIGFVKKFFERKTPAPIPQQTFDRSTHGGNPINDQADLINIEGILIFRFFCEILHCEDGNFCTSFIGLPAVLQ